MGLAIEILGLVVFLGAHVFVSLRKPRAAAISGIGIGPYKGLFSLVALIGIVLIGVGFARYRAGGPIALWYPPLWTRQIPVALMWPASILVVAAYIPGDIKRVLHSVDVWVEPDGLMYLTDYNGALHPAVGHGFRGPDMIARVSLS